MASQIIGNSIVFQQTVQAQGKNIKTLQTWLRLQMETFSPLLAFCEGNSPVTGEFPSQRPVTRSFDVFFYLRIE